MKKIIPQPEFDEAKQALDWLNEGKNNGLADFQITSVIRLLIAKINELSDEVDYLTNRVDNTDKFF